VGNSPGLEFIMMVLNTSKGCVNVDEMIDVTKEVRKCRRMPSFAEVFLRTSVLILKNYRRK